MSREHSATQYPAAFSISRMIDRSKGQILWWSLRRLLLSVSDRRWSSSLHGLWLIICRGNNYYIRTWARAMMKQAGDLPTRPLDMVHPMTCSLSLPEPTESSCARAYTTTRRNPQNPCTKTKSNTHTHHTTWCGIQEDALILYALATSDPGHTSPNIENWFQRETSLDLRPRHMRCLYTTELRRECTFQQFPFSVSEVFLLVAEGYVCIAIPKT